VEAGVTFLREQAAIVAGAPAGDAAAEAAVQPAPAHAALASLCQALVISNGFLYVE
jgi:hypothetical protein